MADNLSNSHEEVFARIEKITGKRLPFIKVELCNKAEVPVIRIIGGAIMLLLGIIGEYVGRIYICINRAPQYVIKEIIY